MISKNMFCKPKFLDRFSMMLNDEEFKSLTSSRIIVFGIGGVGGAVAEMLVRSGVSNLTVVDFDTIDETNINRQVIANSNNIGKQKVDEFFKIAKSINPEINITTLNRKLDENNIDDFELKNYDYIVDCIDDLTAKKCLIKFAFKNKIKILSAMGAGNRYKEIPVFEIADIHKTSYDPIAKILRKFCEKERINKLSVCYTKQKAMKFDCKTIGSVIYYPMNMATVMVAKIINDILKG